MKKLLLILTVSLFAGSAFAGGYKKKSEDATKTDTGAAVVEQSADAAKKSADKAATDAKKAAKKVSKKAEEAKKDAKKY